MASLKEESSVASDKIEKGLDEFIMPWWLSSLQYYEYRSRMECLNKFSWLHFVFII